METITKENEVEKNEAEVEETVYEERDEQQPTLVMDLSSLSEKVIENSVLARGSLTDLQ